MKLYRGLLVWTSMAIAVSAIVVWLTLASLGILDSGKFEIVQSQKVSEGHIAMLVRRSDNTALSGDTYFVIIGSHLYEARELKKAFYSSRPVFVAGRSGLDLYSASTDELTIECRGCGITSDLVEKQRFSDNSIVVRYVGFP